MKHFDENEVKKAMDETDPEAAILLFTKLKLRGDHLHNLEVMIKKYGNLVVSRANPDVNPEDYLPCAFCKVFEIFFFLPQATIFLKKQITYFNYRHG